MSEPDYSLVDDSVCVWCKEAPDNGVETHSIGTGEVICHPCLEDARAWKRPIHFTVFTSTRIEKEDRDAISAAAYDAGVHEIRDRGYSGNDYGNRLSNASQGVVESPRGGDE